MPPIPVHIDDPITPKKAEGVTPQTADQAAALRENIATTTAQDQSPAYPPARPGAAAVPAPTPYVPRPQAAPTTTTQASLEQNGPPPPRPGAVPIPPSQQVPMTPTASTLPPPPKPGEVAQQRQTSMSMPSQLNVPSPQHNYAPTHSTAAYSPTSTHQQSGGPTTLNLGPVTSPAAQHPLGYHQNVNAQDLSSAQRASLEGQERKESIVPALGGLGSMGGDAASETAGNMWNTVKGWASTASEKLVETEESVWKQINGR